MIWLSILIREIIFEIQNMFINAIQATQIEVKDVLTSVFSYQNVTLEQTNVNPLFFSVAKATLQSQMSVRPSVSHRNPSASQNCSCRPLSLSTIEPIDHWAYQPLSLLTIEPIKSINHHAYWPSSLSYVSSNPINHQAHWPWSLLTLVLLSRILSLSACFILILFGNFMLVKIVL